MNNDELTTQLYSKIDGVCVVVMSENGNEA
jgi:hypothetical protein